MVGWFARPLLIGDKFPVSPAASHLQVKKTGEDTKKERGHGARERRGSFQHISPAVVIVVGLSDLLTISGCTPSGWTRQR